MTKYSKKMKEKIVMLIEEDTFSVTEICRIVGIGRKAFYNWKATKPDFAKEIEEAVRCREERLTIKARKALAKKLDGHSQVETKITYTPILDDKGSLQLKIKEYVVKEKWRDPETSAIAYALANSNKENKELTANTSLNNIPLVITVNDEKTKRNLELLQQRLA